MNLVTIDLTEDEKKLVLKVFDCLVDTVQNVTDLDNVYSEWWRGESVSWAEVYKVKEYLIRR